MDLSWMAWTSPTAIFLGHRLLLLTFTVLAITFPETRASAILRIETTRGDRLFITLLGSAFINLAWLGLEVGPSLVCAARLPVYAAAVFRTGCNWIPKRKCQ
jgi:predicted small integral membrane protein